MDTRDSLSELHMPHPCPKRWGELQGDNRKRFCSSCSLHVHDTALLTRAEARELLGNGAARVCLRIEYDASGSARFREGRWTRVRRCVLAAAAGLLAFCSAGGKSQAMHQHTLSSTGPVADEKHEVMGSPAPTGPRSQPGSKPEPKPKAKPKPKPKPGPPSRKP
jgi:hypothetical protein